MRKDSKIDVYDLNYEFCSEALGNLNNTKDTLPQAGIIIRILSLIKATVIIGVSEVSRNRIKSIPSNSTLMFSIAKNEFLSISPVEKKMNDAYIFGDDNFRNGFPMFRIYLISLIFIPIALINYLKNRDPHINKASLYSFDGFCIAYGADLVLRKYLRKIKPKQIVITNHLNVFHRSLSRVAVLLNIKTIFIQHASIANGFPSLSQFSIALLEGQDSLNKYQQVGLNNCNIFLVGSTKFDAFMSEIRNDREMLNIGVCINGMDSFEGYEELLNRIYLKYKNKNHLHIRPHPADRRRDLWKQLTNSLVDVKYSDYQNENAFDFLKKMDLIIAGDSNIHLEAVMLNIPCIYFDPLKTNLDWYGFSKQRLVSYCDTIESVFTVFENFKKIKLNVREKAKYYIDTINTKMDGQSCMLVASILSNQIDTLKITSVNDEYNNIIWKCL
jgi:hypothetical protein